MIKLCVEQVSEIILLCVSLDSEKVELCLAYGTEIPIEEAGLEEALESEIVG